MAIWDPFREMDELRREVDRAFESFATGRRPGRWRAAFLPGYGARQYPLVNVHEDKDNLYVEALAPGVNPESLDLTIQGATLTISGEKRPSSEVPAEAVHRSERSAGKFVRTVDLPYPVNDAGLAASYRNGLLLVTLPKHEAARPRQISVRVG
jgi:HSP20 family protein